MVVSVSENPARPILIVEDNEDDLFFLKRSLSKLMPSGEVPTVATDGQEALDFLLGKGPFANRRVHPLPRLVFLDLKLPYVLGFDVLAIIRATPDLHEMPVIILTSSSQDSDRNRSAQLGAIDYLVKPASESALRSAMGQIAPCGTPASPP